MVPQISTAPEAACGTPRQGSPERHARCVAGWRPSRHRSCSRRKETVRWQDSSASGNRQTQGRAAPRGPHRAAAILARPAAPRGRKEISADWRHLKSWLVTVRGKWDLAVLVNLDRGVERPGDLIETINKQAATDISWKVLIATLRRLEHEGYVRHAGDIPAAAGDKVLLLPGRAPAHQRARPAGCMVRGGRSRPPGSPDETPAGGPASGRPPAIAEAMTTAASPRAAPRGKGRPHMTMTMCARRSDLPAGSGECRWPA